MNAQIRVGLLQRTHDVEVVVEGDLGIVAALESDVVAPFSTARPTISTTSSTVCQYASS